MAQPARLILVLVLALLQPSLVAAALAPRLIAQEAAATGSLDGRVVDPDGDPSPSGWRVEGRLAHWTGEGQAPRFEIEAAGRGDGRFQLDSLEPGIYLLQLYALQATASGTRWSFWAHHAPPVAVRPGETTQVEIVFSRQRPQGLAIEIEHREDVPFITPDAESFRIAEGRHAGTVAELVESQSGSLHVGFPGLPDAEYTIEFSQAGYAPWTGRVRPGSPVTAELRGTGTLRLSLVDAATGEPVHSPKEIDALVIDPTRNGPRWPLVTRGNLARIGRRDGAVLVAGELVPGPYTLTVTADGFQEEKVKDLELEPGSTLDVRIALRRPAAISGVVVDPEGRPVEGVWVGVYEPATHPEASATRFHSFGTDWNLMQPGPWVHSERVRARTDADGCFLLEKVPSGTWMVRAYRSPTVDVVQRDVVVGDRGLAGDLKLVLPLGSMIAAKLALPPDRLCEHMTAWAWQMEGDEAVSFPIANVPVASDGRFEIGPFDPGEVDVWLKVEPGFTPMNTPYHPGEYDPPLHSLGRVSIPPTGGDVAREFDLSETFPAHVRLTAAIDARPAAGARLQVVDASTGQHLATAVADLQGTATLGPFFVTTARALVADPAGAWFGYGESTVTPPAGGIGELAASVSAARGRFAITDTEGEPLAGEIICIYHETPFGWWWAQPLLRTDATGGVELIIPPRRLRVTYVGEKGAYMLPRDGQGYVTFLGPPPFPEQPDESMPLVDWTADGPRSETIRLVR